jgi:hypothetical protein
VGRGLFEPVGASVEYDIEADETGPGETQHELYRRIEAKYRDPFTLIAPLLGREYEICVNPTGSFDVARVFSLNSLSIPRRESDDMEWVIDFSCSDSEDWLFTVQMKGWKPTGHISVMH